MTLHTAMGKMPSELLLGRSIWTKLNAPVVIESQSIIDLKEQVENYWNLHFKKSKTFSIGQYIHFQIPAVWKGHCRFIWPMKIMKIISPFTYLLDGVKKANSHWLVTAKKQLKITEIDIKFCWIPKLPTVPLILSMPPLLPCYSGCHWNQLNRYSPAQGGRWCCAANKQWKIFDKE